MPMGGVDFMEALVAGGGAQLAGYFVQTGNPYVNALAVGGGAGLSTMLMSKYNKDSRVISAGESIITGLIGAAAMYFGADMVSGALPIMFVPLVPFLAGGAADATSQALKVGTMEIAKKI